MLGAGYRGFGTSADAFLGLVFALGFTIVLTDGVKLLVGRPRPNYAALQALAAFNADKASDFQVRQSFMRGVLFLNLNLLLLSIFDNQDMKKHMSAVDSE